MKKTKRPIEFVGDLSVADATVLVNQCLNAMYILEFGAGGSTQIFAQMIPRVLISVETDQRWAEAVRREIHEKLPDHTQPLMIGYTENFWHKFDVIFVDGADDKRLDFAIATWDALRGGGTMLFHDTRRPADLENALIVANKYGAEVEAIEVNALNSNITILRKRESPLHYENWHEAEGFPETAYSLLAEAAK